MIRHITAAENVVQGKLIHPEKTKHGEITAGRVSGLSGWIDPHTHLNLDFPESLMSLVVVSEKLEIGGKILTDRRTFQFATVEPSAFRHRGQVDLAVRNLRIREARMKLRPESGEDGLDVV